MFLNPWSLSYFLLILPCMTWYRNPGLFVSVVYLVWCFLYKQCCRLLILWLWLQIMLGDSFFVVLIFLNYCIFVIMCISYYYLCYSTLGFLTWLFCHGISWHIRAYHSNEILVHLKVLCARIPFPCDNIHCKPCKYPCIGNLLKGVFLPMLTFWSRLCFCLVIFHQELVMNTLNS